MEDYKVRFKEEYILLKEKTNKLRIMIYKYHEGVLEFDPSCPIKLLEKQLEYMQLYLLVLEQRANIECISLITEK